MSLNVFMHERNPYKDKKPDFCQLAKTFPEFARHCDVDVHGKINFDFKNPEAVRMLTWALLKSDFDLEVQIPPGTLVPRIPLRLNYILWIEDLINLQGGRGADGRKNLIHGIDIGTGASCIYPLLAARKCGWRFLATERDEDSWKAALKNVERNGFGGRITVVRTDEGTALLPLLQSEPHCSESFEFCMCNPPFYDISTDTVVKPNTNFDDVCTNANSIEFPNSENGGLSTVTSCAGISMSGKSSRPNRPPPHSATVAKLTEVVAEGGEIRFVKRIIADSCRIRGRVRIYTSMVGKKSSLRPLRTELHRAGVMDVAETTFCQGRTVRWALAWTFCDDVKLKDPQKPLNPLKRGKPVCGLYFDVARSQSSLDCLANTLLDQLADLKINTEFVSCLESSECLLKFRCRADVNTWSHQRRKRRDLQRLDNEIAAKHARKSGTIDVGIMCFPRALLVSPNDSLGHLAVAESGSKISTLLSADIASRSTISESQHNESVEDALNAESHGGVYFGSDSGELPVNGDDNRKRTHSAADFDAGEAKSNAEGERGKRVKLWSCDGVNDEANWETEGCVSGGDDSANRMSKLGKKDNGHNFVGGVNNDLCSMSRTESSNQSRRRDHARILCDPKSSTDWPNLNNGHSNSIDKSTAIISGSLNCCEYQTMTDSDQLLINYAHQSGFKSTEVQVAGTEPELSIPGSGSAGEFCEPLAKFYLSITMTNEESSFDRDSDHLQSGSGGSCFRVGFDWLNGSDRDGMQQIFTCLSNGMGVRSNNIN